MDETTRATTSEYPLSPLTKRWWNLLKVARDAKNDAFGEDAAEMMKFFICGRELHESMWDRHYTSKQMPYDDEESMPAPKFRVCVGKVAEGVELFGPTLYHRNPEVTVAPKTPDIPNELLFPLIPPEVVQQAQMAAQQQGQQFDMNSLIPPDPGENGNKIAARLLQYFINYIQRENDKKTHARRAIDEAIIKGMGTIWTETYEQYPGGPTMVGSFYDTVDNLLVDPDAETLEECWWIARKRIQPYWYVAQKFKLDEDYLREKYTTHESRTSEAVSDDPKRPYRHRKAEGDTNDLIVYWEVYSKMGFGAERLKGSPHGEDQDSDSKAVEETLSKFGDNVYFAVAEKIPFFLNFKTDHLHELMTEPDQEVLDQMHEEKLNDVQWPIPFWADGQWPMTPIVFHEVPNSVWPMGHFKPGLGYLKFLNWVISFLINKIRISSRTVAATIAGMDDEIKDRLFSGKDFELLDLKSIMGAGADVNKLISFLQMPEVHPDVWKIVESVFQLFDKATGLTEIMYGSAGGMRSATEANEKAKHASVRTDDMAAKVEEALTLACRKEAMAARWLLERDSLAPILGERCVALWEQFVASKNIQAVAREFNYTIEAGSTRKPDKERMAQNAVQMIQYVPPLLQAAANPQFNGVVNKILEEAAEANDWGWKSPIIPAPVPQPNPMQQKVEAEIQGKQQELQMKMQAQQADLQMQAQKHAIDLQATQAKAQADMQKAGMQMQTEQVKAQNQMQLEREKAQQEVTLSKMDMLAQIASRQQEARLGAQEHQMQMAHQHDVHRQGLAHAEQKAQADRARAKEKPSGDTK